MLTPYSGTEPLTDLLALVSDVRAAARDVQGTALAGDGSRAVQALR